MWCHCPCRVNVSVSVSVCVKSVVKLVLVHTAGRQAVDELIVTEDQLHAMLSMIAHVLHARQVPALLTYLPRHVSLLVTEHVVTGHSLVTGHWSLSTWSLVTHWSLVTGHWSLVTGHWSLSTWSLVTHWSLVTGH